jgi:hypothetical protein
VGWLSTVDQIDLLRDGGRTTLTITLCEETKHNNLEKGNIIKAHEGVLEPYPLQGKICGSVR